MDITTLSTFKDILPAMQRHLASGRIIGKAKDVQALAERAQTLAKNLDSSRPLPAEARQAAFLLSGPAMNDRIGDLFNSCVWFWRELGPLGRMLMLVCIRAKRVPFPVHENALAGLPLSDQLLLAEQYCRPARPPERAMDSWTRSVFQSDLRKDIPQLLHALARLWGWTETPACALRDVLSLSPGPAPRLAREAGRQPKAARYLSVVPELPVAGDLHTMLQQEGLSAEGVESILDCLDRSTAPAGSRPGAPDFFAGLEPVLERELPPRMFSRVLETMARLDPARCAPVLVQASEKLAARGELEKHAAALGPAILFLGKGGLQILEEQLPKEYMAALARAASEIAFRAAPDLAARALLLLRTRGQANNIRWLERKLEAVRLAPRAPLAPEEGTERQDSLMQRAVAAARRAAGAGNAIVHKAMERARELLEEQGKNAADLELLNLKLHKEHLQDLEIDRCSWIRPSAREAVFVRVSFTGATLHLPDFRNIAMQECRFVNCQFIGKDMGGAMLENVRFVDCVWSESDMAGASMQGCTFERCVMDGISWVGVRLLQCGFSACSLHRADISAAMLDGSRFTTVLFECADLSTAVLRRVELHGVTFRDSVLDALQADRLLVRGGGLEGSAIRQCRFIALDADEPGWRRAAELDLRRALRRAAQSPGRAILNRVDEADHLSRLFVEAWKELSEAQTLETRYRQWTAQRLELARGCYGWALAELLDLLPYVFASDGFERQRGQSGGYPLCRIQGYAPTPGTREAARKHFEGFNQLPEAPQLEADFLALSGGVGSVAMDKDTPITALLCLRPFERGVERAKPLQELESKIRLFVNWAQRRFNVSLAIHVCDREQAAQGVLQPADKHAASGELAKDDFFAMALVLAGGPPEWWAQHSIAPVTDMGGLSPWSSSLYLDFGLRQLVDGLRKPLEACLRMGLLDRFVAGQGRETLSGSLRANLQSGRWDPMETDPYGLLYAQAADWARSAAGKDRSTAELIDLAFLSRLGVAVHHPPGAGCSSFHKRRATRSLVERGELRAKEAVLQGGRLERDPAAALELGRRISSYMSAVLQRLYVAAHDGANVFADMDRQTLTELTRPIKAAFVDREHKIPRTPFLAPLRRGFAELRFMSRKTRSNKTVYGVAALPEGGTSEERTFKPLREELDPTRLLVWTVANRIYHSGAVVEVENSFQPMTSMDVWRLLPILEEFFPYEQVFYPPLELGAKPEQTVKAFFLANLRQDRSENRIREVAIIWSTTWGELFCKSFSGLSAEEQTTARESPRLFMKKRVSVFLSDELEMASFSPPMSRCPRIRV